MRWAKPKEYFNQAFELDFDPGFELTTSNQVVTNNQMNPPKLQEHASD
jgi:hypothetical protein